MERKINTIGTAAIMTVGAVAAWFAYQEIPSGWGVSKEVSGWAAFAFYIAVVAYFSKQFDKE